MSPALFFTIIALIFLSISYTSSKQQPEEKTSRAVKIIYFYTVYNRTSLFCNERLCGEGFSQQSVQMCCEILCTNDQTVFVLQLHFFVSFNFMTNQKLEVPSEVVISLNVYYTGLIH